MLLTSVGCWDEAAAFCEDDTCEDDSPHLLLVPTAALPALCNSLTLALLFLPASPSPLSTTWFPARRCACASRVSLRFATTKGGTSAQRYKTCGSRCTAVGGEERRASTAERTGDSASSKGRSLRAAAAARAGEGAQRRLGAHARQRSERRWEARRAFVTAGTHRVSREFPRC